MTETGTNFGTYTRLYKEQWPELMEMHDDIHMPLRNYANGSVATTWTISFKAIQHRNLAAANLLLLWAHLDNKNLWYELLARASQKSKPAAERTEEWLGKMAHSEVYFMNAINILRSYSLVEEAEDLDCYSTHPVVHQWAFHMQDDSQRTALSWLAVVLVGLRVPSRHEKNFWEAQIRLLPHAEQCETYVMTNRLATQGLEWGDDEEKRSKNTLIIAVCRLGDLFSIRHKLNTAEKMYMLVLGNEKNLSKQSNIYGIEAAHCLGHVYRRQKKFSEAKELLLSALEFEKRMYGESARETLRTIRSVTRLYNDQGKFDEAEETIMQALDISKRTLGTDHLETLRTLQQLGRVYYHKEKYEKARQILLQVLESRKKTPTVDILTTIEVISDLGLIYCAQEKFVQAEKILTGALEGYEKILGPKDTWTFQQALRAMCMLGLVYSRLDKLDEAEECRSKVLLGYEKLLGKEHEHCQSHRGYLADLDRRKKERNSGKLEEDNGVTKANDDNDTPLLALAAQRQDQQQTTTTSFQQQPELSYPDLHISQLNHLKSSVGEGSGTSDGKLPDTANQNDQPTRRKGWSRKLGERIFRKNYK